MLVGLSSLSGCVSVEEQHAEQGVGDFLLGAYPHAEQMIRPAAEIKDQNFVLNNDRLGSAALAAYDLDTAESAFLRSYEVINSVGVNSGGRTLGAVLVSENIKVWKGEPYEQAMVNFYLGLIYYMRHEYANARGAFENSLFKLRDYGEEKDDKGDKYKQVESNFALGYLMLAKSYQRLGRDDQAKKNFDRVAALAPYLKPLADPAMNQQSNVLLVVDLGRGPQKETTFDQSIIAVVPTPQQAGPIPLPTVYVDGAPADVGANNRPPVDLLALGQDRRWQSIDTIRAVKAALGTGLIVAGAANAELNRRSDPLVSLGLIASGLLLKASSGADLRHWEMLPRTVFVIPLHLSPGPHDISVVFGGFTRVSQQWHGLIAPAEGDATYYMRMDRFNPGPFNWPPPTMAQAPTTKVAAE
jgi:tetratricopeptide (TPR) repeat protein